MNAIFLGAAGLFLFLLLATFNALVVPASSNIACATNMCVLVRTFSEYQTVFGAGLAVFAAYVAAKPVWLQVNRMKMDQEIAARDMIARRIRGMEKRKSISKREMDELLDDIHRTIYPHPVEYEYDPDSLDMQWVHNKMHHCGQVALSLEKMQINMLDTATVESRRQLLITALLNLEKCFDDICAYARLSGDYEVSDDDLEKIRRVGLREQELLPTKVQTLSDEYDALSTGMADEIIKLRRRVRQIDDEILVDEG